MRLIPHHQDDRHRREYRSPDGTWRVRWSLCGVFLYDEKQIVQGDEPATCGKCQRYTTATSYLKRREAMKAAKKKPGRGAAQAASPPSWRGRLSRIQSERGGPPVAASEPVTRPVLDHRHLLRAWSAASSSRTLVVGNGTASELKGTARGIPRRSRLRASGSAGLCWRAFSHVKATQKPERCVRPAPAADAGRPTVHRGSWA